MQPGSEEELFSIYYWYTLVVGQVRLHSTEVWHGSEGGSHSKELGGAPVREVEMEPSGAAQPHLEAAGIADAPRLGHGADPQPRRGRTAEVNGRRRQRMGASPRSFSRVTEFRPSRGGSGVHEKGPCKRTRVLP